MKKLILLLTLLLMIGVPSKTYSQKKSKNPKRTTTSYDQSLYEGLEWRHLGPFRGGRSAAVTGVPGKPNLYYMGATGGGVWRTQDGGQSWKNISDGFFGGSIGAIDVSKSDPNVIYVGGGEVTIRGNVSHGNGMWKSVDAGETWKHIGLPHSRHIPRIRIHPKNPDLVYAAVLGDLYKSSEERGVYRSKDGGATWERILFANVDAGAVDLILDPSNPRILYASTWRVRRTPYDLSSGGEGSALWKSTDKGDTWTRLSDNKGFPTGTLGIIGVTVSPAKPDRVWALIESQKSGGVYRSDNGGKTWELLNAERKLRQRAWYYTRIYAGPLDEDEVYVANVNFHHSKTGGKTFETISTPHGDHHDFWVSPEDPNRMIVGDDGGAQVSFDHGQNWSTYHNQPTAQFYRVTTDNHFPYRIYVAQQDNSTIRIANRTNRNSISERDWESTAGGESAHIAIDPTDNDIVYGGSYGGYLTRVNHRTQERRAINIWPDNPLGHGAEGMKYRFQWNFPVFFSPHEPQKLYACSQHIHVSTDEGNSWKIISPDLTRNDPQKLVSSGGPITKDNTGVEYYCTVFAAAESPYEAGLIWAGSDDGLIHLTRNGGQDWENVTPPTSLMPEWAMVNSIEVDPFHKGGLYVAATLYKWGDNRPLLFKTEDYGKTWKKITAGIPDGNFTRVVRADPAREGLLYCGTEAGMYISFDDGASWQAFQQNLPEVPITDLTIKFNGLIAATQGRSIWMVDDLTPLHQLNNEVAEGKQYLFRPMDNYRMSGNQAKKPSLKNGTNHPGGIMVYFYLKNEPDSAQHISLTFLEKTGKEIKAFSTDAKEDKLKDLKAGLNRFVWDLRYADAKKIPEMIMWFSQMQGPIAVPGEYEVRLKVEGTVMTQPFRVLKDPRSSSDISDLQEQFDFLTTNRDKLTETHETILQIREARKQIEQVKDRVKKDSSKQEIMTMGTHIDSVITEVEKALYQTQNRSAQDPLNFPIRLNNKLGHVAALTSMGDFPPTEQAKAVQQEMIKNIDDQLKIYQKILQEQIPAFNRLVKELDVDAIRMDKPKPAN